jgi:hypothetical protein
MQCRWRRLEGSHADRPRLVGCRSMLAWERTAQDASSDPPHGGISHTRHGEAARATALAFAATCRSEPRAVAMLASATRPA